MDKRIARIWYLLDWNDRDKCLVVSTAMGALYASYWLLLGLVGKYTQFGHLYVSPEGWRITRWLFTGGMLIWLILICWGWSLRRRDRQSRLYVNAFMYLFAVPLLPQGHMIGLYNPVVGIMLLGSMLTGAILFDLRRIILPSMFACAGVLLVAWLNADYRLEYAPLLKLDPVSKFHISGVWVSLMLMVATPFLLGVLAVVWLLLSRWREREEMVRYLSDTDTLTGLPNRRALFTQIEHELNRARRKGEPLALVMLDIDHFKQVNDTHGHAAGDAVLKQLGEQLSAQLRSVDLFGRIGGEEFVILLPSTSQAGAEQVIERCRHAIEAAPVAVDGNGLLSITASFGICPVQHMTVELGLQDLLERADRALYRAKHNGRNRVEVHREDDGKQVRTGN